MSYPYTEIESVQPELFLKLANEGWFSPISIFQIRKEDIQTKINEALGEGVFDPGQSGKSPGAVIQVFQPTLLEIYGPLFMSYPAVSNLQYRLSEADGGTLIKFRHTALGLLPDDLRKNVSKGWSSLNERIRTRAEGK